MTRISLIKKIGANLLIVLFLLIMLRAHLDQKSPLVRYFYYPINSFQSFFSFYQNWGMFSPNPSRITAYVDAEVEFTDGRRELVSFLRPSRDELIKRYLFGERFRKYFAEGIRMDQYSHLWPAASQYVFSQMQKKYPDRKVYKIRLQRHWYNIPDWKKEFIPFTHKPEIEYNHFIFYTWDNKNEPK